MPKKNLEQLVMSLYNFVKDEADNTRKEFGEIKERLDRIEGSLNSHDRRISNLEDSSRVVKTKLGLI